MPDSDSEESEGNWNVKINSNNPFFEQIQLLNESMNVKAPVEVLENQDDNKTDLVNSCEEASETSSTVTDQKLETTPTAEPSSSTSRCLELPDPIEFGNGNPFLMFLCLTLLLQHRDYIMQNNLDYNEMAMHFDKMVRKHNVIKVLNQARRIYQDYLRRYNEKMKNTANSK